jgi:hypothetical protein
MKFPRAGTFEEERKQQSRKFGETIVRRDIFIAESTVVRCRQKVKDRKSREAVSLSNLDLGKSVSCPLWKASDEAKDASVDENIASLVKDWSLATFASLLEATSLVKDARSLGCSWDGPSDSSSLPSVK